MNQGDVPQSMRPRPDLFDKETHQKIRLTPEGEGREANFLYEAPGAEPPNATRLLGDFWPDLSDIDSTESAAYQGVGTARFCGLATAIFAVLGSFGPHPIAKLQMDAWSLGDAALRLAIAWGTYRMSRVAAILGLVFYLAGRVHMWSTLGPRVSTVAMILIFSFISAICGAFAFHELARKGSSPPTRRTKTSKPTPSEWRWGLTLLASVGVIVAVGVKQWIWGWSPIEVGKASVASMSAVSVLAI